MQRSLETIFLICSVQLLLSACHNQHGNDIVKKGMPQNLEKVSNNYKNPHSQETIVTLNPDSNMVVTVGFVGKRQKELYELKYVSTCESLLEVKYAIVNTVPTQDAIRNRDVKLRNPERLNLDSLAKQYVIFKITRPMQPFDNFGEEEDDSYKFISADSGMIVVEVYENKKWKLIETMDVNAATVFEKYKEKIYRVVRNKEYTLNR